MTMAKMKSENACDRKSRCTLLPGIFPMILLEAIAILACAIWASLSISYLAAGTASLSSKKPLMRFCQVSTRCIMGTLFSLCVGITITMPAKSITTTPTVPINLANCFQGTRPITIIKKTTPNSNAAVEPFSGAIRMKTTPVIHIIYLNAFGLALSSS